MAKGIIFLCAYHLLLFRHFWFINPYVYARSEALEQGFASSILLGRCLRRHEMVRDDFYYPDYVALPFLSSFYPPQVIQAWLGSFLSLDGAWIVYATTMVLHFWLCSVTVYILLMSSLTMSSMQALFGAVTLSSLGYAMKQNSCINYTAAWVPVWLLSLQVGNWSLAGISLGMMLLAGYWPIALYAIPLGCLATLWH